MPALALGQPSRAAPGLNASRKLPGDSTPQGIAGEFVSPPLQKSCDAPTGKKKTETQMSHMLPPERPLERGRPLEASPHKRYHSILRARTLCFLSLFAIFWGRHIKMSDFHLATVGKFCSQLNSKVGLWVFPLTRVPFWYRFFEPQPYMLSVPSFSPLIAYGSSPEGPPQGSLIVRFSSWLHP